MPNSDGTPLPHIRDAPEKWTIGDVLALSAMQPLIGQYIPWTSWSMRPAALASVVNDVFLRGRRTIVELGAGSSTLILAKAVRQTGGRIVSIEHDGPFAAAVTRHLQFAGLSDVATVAHVPLSPLPSDQSVSADGCAAPEVWYDRDQLEAAVPDGIDLLLVDGPPAGQQDAVLIREPAIRLLRHKLGASFSIYLDDLEREPERRTLQMWEAQLQIPFTVVERIALGVGSTEDGFDPTF